MKRRKLYWTLAIAAVLLAGGLVVTGKLMKDRDETSDVILLTAQQDSPAAHGMPFWSIMPNHQLICPSETGWYFRTCNSIADAPMLSYADRETGQQLPLCPKPNCTHDGNIFCTATTKAYELGSTTPIYVEGSLYALAVKHPNPEKPVSSDPVVLLRYAPDGSEITELCNFGSNTDVNCNPIYHRGYIWCCYSRADGAVNPLTNTTGSYGWEIAGYSLATGKSTVVYSVLPPDPAEEISYYAPKVLLADGDFLYFILDKHNMMQPPPGLSSGLCRLSLTDGTAESVFPKDITFFSDGYVYYVSNGLNKPLTQKNLSTGETVPLVDDGGFCAMAADADHVFIATGVQLLAYDHDGTLLMEVPLPYDAGTKNMAICDGTLYLNYWENRNVGTEQAYTAVPVLYTDIAALLNGKPNWQTAYEG